jgi:hypothetical protein
MEYELSTSLKEAPLPHHIKEALLKSRAHDFLFIQSMVAEVRSLRADGVDDARIAAAALRWLLPEEEHEDAHKWMLLAVHIAMELANDLDFADGT